MKFTKIFNIIVLAACLITSVSCYKQIDREVNIDEVNAILDKFNSATDLDMSFTMKVGFFGMGLTTTSSRVITKKEGDYINAYVNVNDPTESYQAYYINEFICTIIDDRYEVSEADEFEYLEEIPLPTDLNFEEIDYDIKYSESSDNKLYSITIDNEEVHKYVEGIIGEIPSELSGEMLYELTIDKSSDLVDSFRIKIDLSIEDVTSTIDLLVKINAVGDSVEINMPKEVIDAFNTIFNNEEEPDIYPNPNPDPLYTDTSDGVVDYHFLGNYKDIVFDQTSNKLIVQRATRVDIYDATTLQRETKISTTLKPVAVDADNGILVIGYGTKLVKLYDLNTLSEIKTIKTTIDVDEVAIDGNILIYASNRSYHTLSYYVFYNINTDEIITQSHSLYSYDFIINHEDHILYAANDYNLVYFNLQNGECISAVNMNSLITKFWFDGSFVHFAGKSFNRYKNEIISSSDLNRFYASYSEFTPTKTFYDHDGISFLGSDNNKVAIYNNELDGYAYQYYMDDGSIIPLKDGYFLTLSGQKEYVAIVNMNLVNLDIVEKDDEVIVNDRIEESVDGKYRSLFTTSYSKSITDDKYIYTLNEESNVLKVYDITTLNEVYEERFLIKPASIDAYGGRFIMAFGDVSQIRMYNTTTWNYEIITFPNDVASPLLYNDTIIYNSDGTVLVYDIITKMEEEFGYVNNKTKTSMAINRRDDIIYFGGNSRLAGYDLKTRESIFTKYIYSTTPVSFDGNFIHISNCIFDYTGLKLTNSETARLYQVSDITDIVTLYDDNTISIFSGIKNNEDITIIYDLATNQVIYSFDHDSTNASIVGNNVILFDSNDQVIVYQLN